MVTYSISPGGGFDQIMSNIYKHLRSLSEQLQVVQGCA